jgi:hypothetical protein
MVDLPQELTHVRDAAMTAIAPIRDADDSTRAEPHFLFNAQRTKAGNALPDYYLVYFLLVDLLGFRDLGQFEKVAWSVPIDYGGEAFLIEHRKFGVGVFARDAANQEQKAREITELISRGVKIAEPFFDWLARRAVQESWVNVINKTDTLFDRFQFFVSQHREKAQETQDRWDEQVTQKGEVDGFTFTSSYFPRYTLMEQARWLATAAIDAFFSWSEHVFIHIAILLGNVTSGLEVASLASSNWSTKFKRALDLGDPKTKAFFDDLVEIRRQHRNFIAHGAFGKRGEAFKFHSGAGAVPVLMPHQSGSSRFSVTGKSAFDESAALQLIDEFIDHLWSATRAPARIYLQRTSLPTILTKANDGTYKLAMRSVDDMQSFVDYLVREHERAANMDW